MGAENLLDLVEPMKEFIGVELSRTTPEKNGNLFEKFLHERQNSALGSRQRFLKTIGAEKS